jgi:hypothetical protein
MAQELIMASLELTRHELISQELDKAVLAGKLIPEAVADLANIYGPRCTVTDGTVLLDGKPLPEAVEKIIGERDYVRPQPKAEVTVRADVEARALAGNVSAHGLLMKDLGKADYDAWCKRHNAKPGVVAIKADDNNKEQAAARKNNPWAQLRDENGKINPAAQARIASIISGIGSTKAAALAKAAGMTLDGRKLRGA